MTGQRERGNQASELSCRPILPLQFSIEGWRCQFIVSVSAPIAGYHDQSLFTNNGNSILSTLLITRFFYTISLLFSFPDPYFLILSSYPHFHVYSFKVTLPVKPIIIFSRQISPLIRFHFSKQLSYSFHISSYAPVVNGPILPDTALHISSTHGC